MLIELLKTVILGIIEGITEWLPFSSTGHLILVEDILRLEASDAFWSMFEVVIQLGAILAVVLLFWKTLWPFATVKSTPKADLWFSVGGVALPKSKWLLWAKILVAVLPAAVIGLPLDDWFDAHLHKPVPVAIALMVYGIAFIVLEKARGDKPFAVTSVEDISFQTALGIGCFQALSLIPGTSRSGSTILGASLLSVARPAAAEFSFFLAVPVMVGASGVKALKYGKLLAAGTEVFGGTEALILLVGCAVAFAVSVAAIRFLMDFVKKHSFSAFGYYRILLGAVVLAVQLFR